MELDFNKFDGAGNDFVVVDNRHGQYRMTTEQIALLCHRRFGVGADGLMTLSEGGGGYDFEMRYYNSDGRLGSMCGNGGRCIAAFAYLLGLGDRLCFKAYDGRHEAEILRWDERARKGTVRLSMQDIVREGIKPVLDGWMIDTGSPHYVQQVEDLAHFDVVGEGRRIRNLKEHFPQGTNVDFVELQSDGHLGVRTYERGVEDETWACGTGATAAAIISGNHHVDMRGGQFVVDFEEKADLISGVKLTGPVSFNFFGTWTYSAV